MKKAKKINVVFSKVAFYKMWMLVHKYETEVGWHGTVFKLKKGSGISPRGGYYIDDILVYPQKVGAATVDTDDEPYIDWLYGLPRKKFERIRFQGHSHVNFSVSPSLKDERHRETIVPGLKNDFYIFMILNKRGDMSAKIYDNTGESQKIFTENNINFCVGNYKHSFADETRELKGVEKWSSASTPTVITPYSVFENILNRMKEGYYES